MNHALLSRSLAFALCAAFLCSAPAFSPGGVPAGAMSDAAFVELCEKGTADQVRRALKDGANPDARDGRDVCALEAAIKNREDPVGATKALLAAGAKVNVTTSDDRSTPLMEAAFLGTAEGTEIIRALVAAGADVNARTPEGLGDGGPIPGGRTALMHAARRGDLAAVETLLAAGADPNAAQDETGLTPLLSATDCPSRSSSDVAERVRALLKAGADPNARDHMGDTALHQAALACHAEVTRALLAGGADVNARGYRDDTALMHAVAYSHVEAARALVAGGADKTLKNELGRDALWHAHCLLPGEIRRDLIRLLEGDDAETEGPFTCQ